ncbi:hypothetical protein D1007_44365 [Hordeum vulgare]|nr:hypothetical protein D1007_44365 [Hordeum vulgare]
MTMEDDASVPSRRLQRVGDAATPGGTAATEHACGKDVVESQPVVKRAAGAPPGGTKRGGGKKARHAASTPTPRRGIPTSIEDEKNMCLCSSRGQGCLLKGNIDPDTDELDMVFDFCPSHAELLEQVRKDLNWMDPSDLVEFDGRHNVGFRMHIRWKTMRVNSEQRWLAYKDTVAESLDKSLELFAIKTNVPNLQLDLNRVASTIVEASPPRINEEDNIEPLSTQQSCIQHEPLLEANDEHDDDENDGTVLHDNNLGDLDKYNLQETMDHSIPYSRGYASEYDDEGPDEEVDEEGFTAKEAEAFTKVLGRDHQTPLFEDLSLADEAVVDGGEGILFGVRTPSHRYGGVSTQQGQSGVGGGEDAASEEQRLMERATKKLREEDATEARKKKEEEYNARIEEESKIDLAHWRYEKRMKEQHKKMMEKRQKEWEANFKKVMAEGASKRERERHALRRRVMEEASKIRKREEEEEEERKKEEGKGALLDPIEPDASILMRLSSSTLCVVEPCSLARFLL